MGRKGGGGQRAEREGADGGKTHLSRGLDPLGEEDELEGPGEEKTEGQRPDDVAEFSHVTGVM